MTIHNPTSFQSATPIRIGDAIAFAPTIAADAPHAARSDKYTQISTLSVIDRLNASGFNLHGIVKAKTRLEHKRGFERHALTFRHSDFRTPVLGDDVVTSTLINSHDGSSSYTLVAGLHVCLCSNGLMAGTMFETIKVRHIGKHLLEEIENGMRTMLSNSETMVAQIAAMKSRILTPDETEEFASRALALRFDPERDKAAPVTPMSLLTARRTGDNSASVWHTFNRIQENSIRGGIRGRVVINGRLRNTTLRALSGITQTVHVNRALWDMAAQYAA